MTRSKVNQTDQRPLHGAVRELSLSNLVARTELLSGARQKRNAAVCLPESAVFP
jgi:hypothetical protein